MPSSTCPRRLRGLPLAAWLSLVPVTADAQVGVSAAPTPRDGVTEPPRGLVVSADLGFQSSPLVAFPSGEAGLFLGGALRVRSRRPGHWTALGYRGAVSVGWADLGATIGFLRVFGHRHHVAVQGAAGRRGRFAYAADLGVAQFVGGPTNPDGRFAVETEGRIGHVFGARAGSTRGVFGLRVRLPLPVGPHGVGAPIPTFGLYIGLQFGRGLPEPSAPRSW